MKTLILGGKGYIGCKLFEELTGTIHTVDMELFPTKETKIKNINIDYNLLNKDFIKIYSNIILLAGHSSVRMCDIDPHCAFNNNVRNFVSLLSKLDETQTLIYASSASVYGNCKESIVKENYNFEEPYNMYDLTKQMIDTYYKISKPKARVFGLRFGTVNGYSPVLRDDIMINAMVSSAWKSNKIVLFNSDTKRSILGMNDLTRAIKTILESNRSKGEIYNLASFTKTAGEIAKEVSSLLNCELETVVPEEFNKAMNEKLVSSKYNFALSCDKFSNDFNFSFKENINTIVEALVTNKNNMLLTNRNKPYKYEN